MLKLPPRFKLQVYFANKKTERAEKNVPKKDFQ